jgi:hypothetical protein
MYVAISSSIRIIVFSALYSTGNSSYFDPYSGQNKRNLMKTCLPQRHRGGGGEPPLTSHSLLRYRDQGDESYLDADERMTRVPSHLETRSEVRKLWAAPGGSR